MILLVYGTRPEYLKIKPLINELTKNGIEHKVLFTGQQKDLANFPHDIKINIDDDSNRLDSIVQSLMNNLKFILNHYFENMTHVLVQGDTTTALAMALSAFHHGLKVIHLEAGLRTYDKQNPYPEEVNRRIISQIADIHLCPTSISADNLLHEYINAENIYVVGNTSIDNLLEYKDKCEYSNKILITLHRRENHESMHLWFKSIDILARDYSQYEFIFPLHPNPNVQKHRNLLKNVKVIAPLSFEEMLNFLVKTRLVITDSGGLQEECSFFNKKCLTCRTTTERPEALMESTFLINNPTHLLEMFSEHHDNYEINYNCPFGDGHAAEKIVEILKKI